MLGCCYECTDLDKDDSGIPSCSAMDLSANIISVCSNPSSRTTSKCGDLFLATVMHASSVCNGQGKWIRVNKCVV